MLKHDSSSRAPGRDVVFAGSATDPAQFPTDRLPEVAFLGRSNVGKSSLLNALAGTRGLARVSGAPGRTRLVNFFRMTGVPRPGGRGRGELYLVDLPGYGYAKVPLEMREHWKQEIDRYLHQRRSLRGVVLIADIRHPLKEFDRMMLDFCFATGLPCHLLLTKADKLSRNQSAQALAAMRKSFPDGLHATAQVFSSPAGTGVEEARARVVELLGTPRG